MSECVLYDKTMLRVAIVLEGTDWHRSQELQCRLARVKEQLNWCRMEVRVYIQGDAKEDDGSIPDLHFFNDPSNIRQWLSITESHFCFGVGGVEAPGLQFDAEFDDNAEIVNEVCFWMGARIRELHGGYFLGVAFKRSRMADFAERRFFSLAPTPEHVLHTTKHSAESLTLSPRQNQRTEAPGQRKLKLMADRTELRYGSLLVVPLSLEDGLTRLTLRMLDGVFFKASDFLMCKDANGLTYTEEFSRLLDDLAELTTVCVVDSFDSVKTVLDRSTFPSLLPSSGEAFHGFPSQFVLQEEVAEDRFVQDLERNNMGLPVIVKPLLACGLPGSHDMAFVEKASGISRQTVEYPICVQQFHFHSNQLWKVYVVGAHVFIEQEPSLGRIIHNLSEGVTHFSTLSVKRAPSEEKQTLSGIGVVSETIVELARGLQSSSGLTIFGFDVIVEEESGRHLTVDINHFPSMKRVSRSIEAMHETFYEAIDTFTRNQQA